MKITLEGIGKRYAGQRVWQDISYEFSSGGKHLITGSNGSGKSTLLRVISGLESCSSGVVKWETSSGLIPRTDLYQHMSMCAPYIGIYEEFTAPEFYHFITQFKPGLLPSGKAFAARLELPPKKIKNKPIASFSSGMKQRVKLLSTLALDLPLVLLDEPGSNLDQQALAWYNQCIEEFCTHKTVIIASNDVEREALFCSPALHLSS